VADKVAVNRLQAVKAMAKRPAAAVSKAASKVAGAGSKVARAANKAAIKNAVSRATVNHRAVTR
jgi:hypothetical protein